MTPTSTRRARASSPGRVPKTTENLTEAELIERFRERLGAGDAGRVTVGSGDDAAVTITGGTTVTSVDMAVEGIHFRRSTASPRAIGHKALAAALSDLAAMGAVAREAFVQLGLPPDFGVEGCLELAGGVAALAAEVGVQVPGGDVVAAPQLIVAVTVVGSVEDPGEVVLRSGAQPGDAVCVTGELGGAGAGLLLLERPELAADVDAEVAEALRHRQLEPSPRLAAGVALAATGASAMIDLSDGLGGDAGHLAAASSVRLELESERLPLQPGVSVIARAAGIDELDLAVAAGEDYELLATLPDERLEEAAAAAEAAGSALTSIGRVRPGSGLALRDAAGNEVDPHAFDHFRRIPPSHDASG